MRKLKIPLIILAIIGAIILIKFRFFPAQDSTAKPEVNSGGKAPGEAPLELNGLVINNQKLENKISSTGTLLANEEVQIQPEVSGKITELFIREGTNVKKGELLLKINDLDLLATLSKLKFNLDLAKENEARQRKLLAISAISQQDYDLAKNTVESTEADIEFTKATIEKTRIYAPFAGRIGLRYVSLGAFLTPGTRIADIEQIDPLKLDFSVPGQYANQIRTGDVVNFTLQGVEKKFQARILAVEPKIDLSTRTIHLRALFSNHTDVILFPGSFASVQLVLKDIHDAIMVPTQSVVPVLKGQTVFLYKNGLALQRNVEIGIRTDTQLQITDGLKAGDTVITTGLLSLKTDVPVKLSKISK